MAVCLRMKDLWWMRQWEGSQEDSGFQSVMREWKSKWQEKEVAKTVESDKSDILDCQVMYKSL